MDPSSYASAYGTGNLERAYGTMVDEASTSATNTNFAVPSAASLTPVAGDESASVSISDLESKELALAPGKYLGVLVAKSIAYSTIAGTINFALLFLTPEMPAAALAGQFIVNVIAGAIMLTSISWFALITFAFNSVLIQGTIMMNQLGLLIITTVIDLVICVTMYRILADILAGDKSLLGLSKVL
jgi:hypothetical protein